MDEQLKVNVEDHPAKPDAVGLGLSGSKHDLQGSWSTSPPEEVVVVVVDNEDSDEHAPLIGKGECRICQEEDSLNNMETPCACSGSLKFAHRKCVQHWCNEKGDINCEICHQPYRPGYTAPPGPPSDDTSIDVEEVRQISGSPIGIHDPRLRAIAQAERRLFDAEFDDYSNANNSVTSFCRSAILILLALLLLRHAMSIYGEEKGDEDDNSSVFFSLFLLRAVGFLLPFYIMIWVIGILQRRRQRQEGAGARFAVLVQAAQRRGVLVTPSQANPQPEQV